jgi:hypothetical protein
MSRVTSSYAGSGNGELPLKNTDPLFYEKEGQYGSTRGSFVGLQKREYFEKMEAQLEGRRMNDMIFRSLYIN